MLLGSFCMNGKTRASKCAINVSVNFGRAYGFVEARSPAFKPSRTGCLTVMVGKLCFSFHFGQISSVIVQKDTQKTNKGERESNRPLLAPACTNRTTRSKSGEIIPPIYYASKPADSVTDVFPAQSRWSRSFSDGRQAL